MANEIWHSRDEADTLYALIWRQTDDKVYDAGSGEFDTYTDADIDDYDIPLTNHADSDYHSVDFPTIAAGVYRVQIMYQVGGSIDADADIAVAQGEIYWDGTAEVNSSVIDTVVDAIKAKTDLISAQVVTANPAYMHNPLIDQADIVVAQVGLIKNKPGDAAIQIAEITTAGLIKVWRYRKGTDAGWTVIVNGGGMGAGIGSVYYTYTFPSASWADGDLILYEVYDTVVECDGEVFTLSTVQGFGIIGDTASVAAIVANLGQVHTVEDESPGGAAGAAVTSGIAEGC